MKQALRFVLAGTILFATACSVRVNTRYDPDTDFSAYRTFCWMDGCEFKIEGPDYLKREEIQQAVKEAIVRELNAKGLTEDADQPDLLVGFNITVKNDTAIVFRRLEEPPIAWMPAPQERDQIPFLRGTLIMALADKRKSEIVWQAAAVEYMEVRSRITPENITRGIKKVMRRFPPKKNTHPDRP
jgi:hypothetical protein